MADLQSQPPRLIDRWWAQALAGLWILGIVVWYFRLQLLRLLEVAKQTLP